MASLVKIGIPGGQVKLDVKFYKTSNRSTLVDHDEFETNGTLPTVEIYDPNGNLITTSATSGQPGPIRLSQGYYEYIRAIPLTDTISNKWKVVWKIKISGNIREFVENFTVALAGDADFGEVAEEEYRKGYAFNNPVLDSDHHAPGWGKLVTPDELRYMVGFGNKLVSPDASQTYDDNMLQWYIDVSLAMIERDLDIDIMPRIIRHEDPIDQNAQGGGGSMVGEGSTARTEGARTPRQDIPEGEVNIREPGYAYRPNNARHYLYVQLRRRPLIDCLKAVITDPVQHTLRDIYPWRREFPGFDSRLQFYPNITTPLTGPTGFFLDTRMLTVQYPFGDFPSSIFIDYRTGYLNVADVPIEFRAVLLWTAGIMLMEDFSDGKAPGIASASANLNSVSESYATTQSATNSLLGARIAYYKDHLSKWLKKNKYKYNRNLLGIL
jgi:hypothetical protein